MLWRPRLRSLVCLEILLKIISFYSLMKACLRWELHNFKLEIGILACWACSKIVFFLEIYRLLKVLGFYSIAIFLLFRNFKKCLAPIITPCFHSCMQSLPFVENRFFPPYLLNVQYLMNLKTFFLWIWLIC